MHWTPPSNADAITSFAIVFSFCKVQLAITNKASSSLDSILKLYHMHKSYPLKMFRCQTGEDIARSVRFSGMNLRTVPKLAKKRVDGNILVEV